MIKTQMAYVIVGFSYNFTYRYWIGLWINIISLGFMFNGVVLG